MSLTPGQCRLYSGDFNYVSYDGQPDGTDIVTIAGGKSGQVHRMHVRDLWGEHEEVLTEEEGDSNPPPHVAARLAEVAPPVDVVGAHGGAPEGGPDV